MAFVIIDACTGTKNTACTKVCPCDSIHPTRVEPAFANCDQLYIDPDSCIDCALCAAECPVSAIFPDSELPPEKLHFAAINAQWFKRDV